MTWLFYSLVLFSVNSAFASFVLPKDSLKRVERVLGNENACFILKERTASKPGLVFGETICTKRFPLGNRALLPLSVIATESGLIQDEKTLFKWDGTVYPNRLWNKDQFVTDWLQNQVAWVTDRLHLQMGSQSIEKHLKNFQLEENTSTKVFLRFSEKFFLGALPVKQAVLELSKRFFYVGKYREGAEVWGQKASGDDYAGFTGHLAVKNSAWTFTILLKPTPINKEPLTAERAQALSMDVLTELGLF